jgi:hypothetical protein
MAPSARSETTEKRSVPVMKPKQWDELHDTLTLALDALGDRPEEFCESFFRSCMMQVMGEIGLIGRAGEKSSKIATSERE